MSPGKSLLGPTSRQSNLRQRTSREIRAVARPLPTWTPLGWLENFDGENEVNHAVHLLNAVMYFNDQLLATLLDAAVQEIGPLLVQSSGWAWVQLNWARIVDSLNSSLCCRVEATPLQDVGKSWLESLSGLPSNRRPKSSLLTNSPQ